MPIEYKVIATQAIKTINTLTTAYDKQTRSLGKTLLEAQALDKKYTKLSSSHKVLTTDVKRLLAAQAQQVKANVSMHTSLSKIAVDTKAYNIELQKQAATITTVYNQTTSLAAAYHASQKATKQATIATLAQEAATEKLNAEFQRSIALEADLVLLKNQGMKTLLAENAARERALGINARYNADQREAIAINTKLNAEKAKAIAANERLTASQAKAAAATKNLTNSQTALGSAFRGTAGALGGLWLAYGQMLPMIAAFAAATLVKDVIALGASFEYATTFIKTLGTVAGDSSINVGELQKKLVGLEGLRKGPLELAAGMREFAKAGVSVEVGLENIEELARFATIAEIGLADATALVIGQANAFGVSYADAANMITGAAMSSATSIGEMAQAMSQTTELGSVAKMQFGEVAAALAVMANAGVRGSKAGTSVRTSILRLQSPTSKLTGMLEELGISFSAFDANGDARSMLDMFQELDVKLDALTDQDRVKVIREMFGLRAMKGGANLIRMANEGLEDMIENVKDAAEGTTALEQAAEGLDDTTVAKWERLGVTYEKLVLKVKSNAITNFAIDVADSINQALAMMATPIDSMVELGDQMIASVQRMVSFFKSTDFPEIEFGDILTGTFDFAENTDFIDALGKTRQALRDSFTADDDLLLTFEEAVDTTFANIQEITGAGIEFFPEDLSTLEKGLAEVSALYMQGADEVATASAAAQEARIKAYPVVYAAEIEALDESNEEIYNAMVAAEGVTTKLISDNFDARLKLEKEEAKELLKVHEALDEAIIEAGKEINEANIKESERKKELALKEGNELHAAMEKSIKAQEDLVNDGIDAEIKAREKKLEEAKKLAWKEGNEVHAAMEKSIKNQADLVNKALDAEIEAKEKAAKKAAAATLQADYKYQKERIASLIAAAKKVDAIDQEALRLKEEYAERQKEIGEDLLDQVMEMTLSETDYKRWALEQQMKDLEFYAGDNELLQDRLALYHKLKLDEIAGDTGVTLTYMLDQWNAFGEDFKGSFTDAISGLITGEIRSLGDAWEGLMDSMIQSFADMIADLIVKWAASGLMELIFGNGSFSGFSISGGGSGGSGGVMGAIGTAKQGYDLYSAAGTAKAAYEGYQTYGTVSAGLGKAMPMYEAATMKLGQWGASEGIATGMSEGAAMYEASLAAEGLASSEAIGAGVAEGMAMYEAGAGASEAMATSIAEGMAMYESGAAGGAAASSGSAAGGSAAGAGAGSAMATIGTAVPIVAILAAAYLGLRNSKKISMSDTLGSQENVEGAFGSAGYMGAPLKDLGYQGEQTDIFNGALDGVETASYNAAEGLLIMQSRQEAYNATQEDNNERVAEATYTMHRYNEATGQWVDHSIHFETMLDKMKEIGPVTEDAVLSTAAMVAAIDGVPYVADELVVAYNEVAGTTAIAANSLEASLQTYMSSMYGMTLSSQQATLATNYLTQAKAGDINATQGLIDALMGMGMSVAQATTAAHALTGGAAELTGTLSGAATATQALSSGSTAASEEASQLSGIVVDMGRAFSSAGSSAAGAMSKMSGASIRAPVNHSAAGGMIPGPITGVDNIYAGNVNGVDQLVTGGEYIVNPRSTAKHLAALEAINADRYATGGPVPSGGSNASNVSVRIFLSGKELKGEIDKVIVERDEQGVTGSVYV